jgi:hypothetical protein
MTGGYIPGFPVKFGDKDKLYAAFSMKATGNPGISHVFREMWESENFNGFVYGAKNWGFSGRGIPHLGKNKRDTPTPASLCANSKIESDAGSEGR